MFRRGGFDVIVGNPPFAGKNTIAEAIRRLSRLAEVASPRVARQFRSRGALFPPRVHLLKPNGCFGLIATNTIGQGDTRSTGLRWICGHGGAIYRARKHYKWPGQAAVVVSVVHVHKGALAGPYHLDGRAVDRITAYLFHAGGSEDPETLVANEDKSFQGQHRLGMGFTFDDTDTKGVASPLAEMHRLIEKDPRNAERIFPYIGGEEVNDSPTHAHHRYVINFEDFPLRRKETGHSWFELKEETQRAQLREGIVAPDYPDHVAADWPDLLAIVEERVKGTGASNRQLTGGISSGIVAIYAEGNLRSGVARARLGDLDEHPLCHSHWSGADRFTIRRHDHVAFPGLSRAFLSCSRVHEVWARFIGSSMKDDLVTRQPTASRLSPFRQILRPHPVLEAAGQAYYDFPSRMMVRNNEGLTKTYNRFNDPGEMSSDIVELRRLHDAMDRAVLDAYGWDESDPSVTSSPSSTTKEEDDEESSRKKKRFRYRWPDERTRRCAGSASCSESAAV